MYFEIRSDNRDTITKAFLGQITTGESARIDFGKGEDFYRLSICTDVDEPGINDEPIVNPA